MEREKVHELLRMLGAEKVVDRDEWVGSSCIFAPWTHDRGTDLHPSFGISLGPRSAYHCFTCGQKGRLSHLPTVLWMLSGEERPDLRRFILSEEILRTRQDLHQTAPHAVLAAPQVLEDDIPERDFSPLAPGFRGLSERTISVNRIRADTNRGRVIFPIFTADKVLTAIKGRAVGDADPKYLLYTEYGKRDPKSFGIWYGQHWGLQPGKPLVLVEGEIDALLLKQFSPEANVWAVMGVGITRQQIETVIKTDIPVVFFFDNDMAGNRLRDLLKLRLKGRDLYYISDYHGCHDPGDAYEKGELEKIKSSIRKYM